MSGANYRGSTRVVVDPRIGVQMADPLAGCSLSTLGRLNPVRGRCSRYFEHVRTVLDGRYGSS